MNRHLILLGLPLCLLACSEQTKRKEGFSVHGIDVSHHQQHIEWEKVAAQGIHFAFIKATEGATFYDTLFCRNWDEMQQAGIRRGAYHFFRPNIPAEKQAQNFLEWVTPEDGDLAPVLDVEATDDVAPEVIRAGVRAWLLRVEQAWQIKPIIYTNQKYFNEYLAGYFPGYPVWIARYSAWRKPFMQAGHEWLFWQYGNRGRLDGIEGDVDFNVFRGSAADLETLCFIKPPGPPVSDVPKELKNKKENIQQEVGSLSSKP